jgi:hypothetical protein
VFDPTTYASRALTVAAELVADGERVERLQRTLEIIKGDLIGDNVHKNEPDLDALSGEAHVNTIFRPAGLPDTHFTRFVIVDDASGPDDNRLPPMLVWESNHDGPTDEYLRKVQAAVLSGDRTLDIDAIFGACVDYPGVVSGDDWVAWMTARSLRAEAFYCGYRGVPKSRVDAAGRVHEAIRRYLDAHRLELSARTPLEIHRLLQAHIQQAPPPAPMQAGDLEPAITRGRPFRIRYWATLAMIAVSAVLLLTVFLPVTLAWYALLRYHEKRDKAVRIDRPVHAEPDLIAAEDRIVQNQLTHIVDLKPGLFRYVTQRAVLFTIDQLAAVYCVHGHLTGITSIHFARWVILPDTRNDPPQRRHRLLFFSNYDFSWDSYLGEFVDRASGWLTAVWTNTEGFPRTYRLQGEGADDEEAFKQWTRDHQIPSQVWWSGVRHATVENVNNDIAVHRGAVAPLDEEAAAAWVTRL